MVQKSQVNRKKDAAIKLRKKGKSLRKIEKTLKIARSTLSGWLKDVELTQEQKRKLHYQWLFALVKARMKASEVHRKNKVERVSKVKDEVEISMLGVEIDKTLGKLIFATFYLAEGTKKESALSFSGSNPKFQKAFLNLFRFIYAPNELKFRCSLHLRKDQSEKSLKQYWSRSLGISKCQFFKTQFDKRTNKPSYKTYKGVCEIYYLDVSIQREVLYTGEKIIQLLNEINI